MTSERNLPRSRRAAAVVLLMIALGCTVVSGTALGQQPAPPGQDDAGDYGIRFTPGMARGMARIFVRQAVTRRYELPEEKVAEAEELAARRFMQLAHKIDEPGRELLERFIEEQFAYNSENRGGGGFMPPTFGKEFADRVLPIMPDIRDMMRGVSNDIRPMLPMKQQLKMAGDMMALKTGFDGFEQMMKKWSSGEVTEYGNPFDQREKPKKDDQGQSDRLKGARSGAEGEATRTRADQWKNYIEKFTELYGLDSAQVATAESVLREFTEREQRLLSESGRHDRIYQGQLWSNMQWEIENSWNHPAKWLIQDTLEEAREPIEELDGQFKARLESIPTSSQRRAAEERIEGLLKEKGLDRSEVTK